MLQEIEVFCAIARHKGFAKAARALHISASIATRRLVSLEEKLGVRLLQRTTRHVTLTEAGQLYFEQVSRILENLDASNQSVKSLGAEIIGTLKIGLPVSISHLCVSQHLHTLLAQYPALKIQIQHGNHLFDLLENNFDLILHCGEPPNSNFHYKKIGLWDKVVSASPAYLAKHPTPQTPEDLVNHNCLDHADNFHFSWRFQKQNQVCDVTVNGNVRVNSSIDLLNLGLNGLGLTYLPSFVVGQQIRAGRLVSVLDQYRPPALGMYLIYPSNQYLSQKTRVFMDFITDILQGYANIRQE